MVQFRLGQMVLLLATASRPTLDPFSLPVQWVPGVAVRPERETSLTSIYLPRLYLHPPVRLRHVVVNGV